MLTDPRYARLTPVLDKIKELKGQRLLITIDGPCGSGKSTLAEELAAVIKADIVHMDDFVIPHALKTAERLAQPGGNADVERLMQEVLTPWLLTGHALYRPYLCHMDMLGEPVQVEGQLLILEGSYCNLPEIRRHAALRLFVQVNANEQQSRLLRRVGPERLVQFNERWIPLEQAYFDAYSLPDEGCISVSACYDQVE